MFLFKSTKQAKETKHELDSNLKILLDISATNSQQSLSHKSTIKAYYNQVEKRIGGSWPQFFIKYDRQITRIKKSQSTWNYSDIRVIKHCIKKSMQQETLSTLTERWCEIAIVSLFQSAIQKGKNDCDFQKQTLQKIQLKIKSELLILCSFLFRFMFQLYETFFTRYYSQKNKISSSIKLKKLQIYEKQKYVYEDFIRNCMTGLHCFSHIYNLYLVKTVPPSIGFSLEEKQALNRQFQQFLKSELKIEEDFKQIYINTVNAIKQFHYDPQIQAKIEKACKIIPAIQKDNIQSFKRNKLQAVKKIETITTPMLRYLFKIYCPHIGSSIAYLRMMICYRLTAQEEKQQFQKLIQQYCFLWLHEGVSAKLQVILDAFTFY